MKMDRRSALHKMTVLAGAALSSGSMLRGAASSEFPLVLGLDAHSVRAMKWEAMQLIEYAASLKLDAVLFNGLHYFKSLDTDYLHKVRETADSKGLQIRIGAGGISIGVKKYRDRFGSPEETLALGVRVATDLGSPTVNCRIGAIADRYTEGGIEARLEEAASVIKATRSRAEDAGVRFAFENHAADTRSEEILALINEVGSDLLGVMLDPGNALWAMEDPMTQLEVLGDHVLCTSIRDYTVWEAAEGATFQWTAIGEGMMDVPAYLKLFKAKCPDAPFFVETISNSQRPIPFLTDEFWEGFPNTKAAGIREFLALVRRGEPLSVVEPASGESKKAFEQRHQKNEFEKSIRNLRTELERT